MKYNKTRQVNCGGIAIGGGSEISIQSMCNTDTRDVKASFEQIVRLKEAGCQIVRLAVPDMEAAEAFGTIKSRLSLAKIDIPMVADIHFDYRLALAAIENGADKIRINPGNIGDIERVKAVVNAAKQHHIPIRVGVNSGSLEKEYLLRDGGVTARGLADSAVKNAGILEALDFGDIVISMKASNVRMNNEASRMVAAETDYPLHIGVTETGNPEMGRIKSAAGLGALLLDGIGDTMRVSLTADPVEEVICAKQILKSVGIRNTGIDLVSCPTCGRTKIDIVGIVDEVSRVLAPYDDLLSKEGRNLKIAVMGCAVNGPGEAREADLGIAGGDGKGLIFAKGEIIKSVPENKLIEELTSMVSELV